MPEFSAFASLDESLPGVNAYSGVSTSTLPSGSLSIYETSSSATVVAIPYGSGYVVVVGPDWYQSSSGWNAVLVAAAKIKTAATPPAPPKPPPLPPLPPPPSPPPLPPPSPPSPPPTPGLVKLFDDAAYVDPSREAAKMISALSAASVTVSTFSGVTTASDWTSSTVILPEFERSQLTASSFSSSMQDAIRGYVTGGGVYVVACKMAVCRTHLPSSPPPSFDSHAFVS